ncbi:MAG: response regulator [Acidobacteria bacterium]|nr:response regulator [Acidobacteriota bacterium]
MASQRVLIVEDEEDIAQLLAYNLRRDAFDVITADNGREALDRVMTDQPDLILLDLMLPEVSGIDVCRKLKTDQRTRDIPIIMLTARSEEADMVTGLEMGADDYITKPFSPRVLMARVRAVLRRRQVSEIATDEMIHAGPLVIYPQRFQVTAEGEDLKLTLMEFNLLVTLAKNPGRVYSRDQIVSSIRGDNYAVTDRAVDVLVVGLRKKLGAHSSWVETVRGVGYRFREI